MKTIQIVLFGVAGLLMFGVLSDDDDAPTPRSQTAADSLAPAAPAVDRSWREGFPEYILAENTETVDEAMWSMDGTSGHFWLTRAAAEYLPDGTPNLRYRQDGFAEYVCLEAVGYGKSAADDFMITIWDRVSMLREQWVRLGQFRCELE